jgi:hypothetical protein
MPLKTPWAIRSGGAAVPDRKTILPTPTTSSMGSPPPPSPIKATTPITGTIRSGERGGEIVIPPKHNRKVQRSYDVDLYKERNLIERFFNKLKQFRRLASRYDKLLANFMGFAKRAAAPCRVGPSFN